MSFTVVRAVRGADAPAAKPADRLQSTNRTPPPAPARMDLPFAEDVLQLDLGDFVKTVPGALE